MNTSKTRAFLKRYSLSTKIAVVLLAFCTLSLQASVLAQKISLDTQETTIKNVLQSIEKQTDYTFMYDAQKINLNKKIRVNAQNKEVREVLNEIFSGENVAYEIKGRQIVIMAKANTSNENKSSKTTQQTSGKISGTIRDTETGEPLIGVNVVVKGTSIGTLSDIKGNFSITLPGTGSSLVISYIGYISQTIQILNQSTLNIKLNPDTKKLEEVVVIGYGTQKKGDVTSSVASVKSENFIKGSVKDVGQLIQGKVAGLTLITSSGDPVSNTQVKLRGNTTILGTSTNPLILVDGVPGDFNTVAPEDIEAIDVLKDGSAAAIYGTRGTNGVIIITTKRAKTTDIASVEYSGYITTQAISKKLDMLTASDFRQQIAAGTRLATDDLGASTDWLKEITRTPFSQVHNVTLRGGSAKTNYLASLNYNSAQGIFLKSDKQSYSARTDINHSMFNDLVKINLGLLSRNTQYTTTGDGYSFNGYTYRQALIYNPTSPVKDANGDWVEQPGAFNYDNPLARVKESDGMNKDQFSRFNTTISVNPFKGLTLKSLFSLSKYNQTRGYYETSKNISTIRSGLNGYASSGAQESIDRLVELTAEYAKSIGDHRFTVLGGYSYQDNNWRDSWMRNEDYPSDLFGYNNIGLGTGIKEGGVNSAIGSSRTMTNLIGFFTRATYNYKDKYLMMASLRREAASQLYGTKEPWGNFPAVSFGWRLSKEEFMKDITFIDDLKLRGGYGVTGTQPGSIYLGLAAIGYTGYFYSNGKWIQTLAPTRNPNPYLRWEEKKEANIGLDYSLANSRISGSIDLYNRDIDGLLYDYSVPVPPNLVNTTRANVGKMRNQGIEILANLVPVRKKKFEWNTTVSFSTNSNKLISLSNELYQASTDYINAGGTGEPIQTYTHRVQVGGKIGNFYGFKVIGVDDDGKWIYEDKDGNAVPYSQFAKTDDNKKVLGNGLPKWYAGWNHNFRYKNFDLGITMRGAFGYQILNFDRMYLENTKTVQYNRLRSAYDKVFGKAVLSTDMDLEYNSYYIENGDHWKIDNLTLGYTIKPNTKFIKSARVYVSSLNTLVLTKYKGIDPEVSTSGLDPGSDYRDKYPTTRTFTLGVNLNF